jgi:hypothetical protein
MATSTRLSRAQIAALSAAIRDGAVCAHSRWTYTTGTLRALQRRGLLAPVPDSESGGYRDWYRPTPAGRAAING